MASGDTYLILMADNFIGDTEANLVAGDLASKPVFHNARHGWSFDDTDEEAIVSQEFPVPSGLPASIKAIIHFAMASDATNDIALDVFVESKTPNSDTLDMETADSWDAANSGTKSLATTTAGDPLTLEITLTNKDSIAVGDLARIGIRRDCDSANDDAVGDLFIYAMEIQEV